MDGGHLPDLAGRPRSERFHTDGRVTFTGQLPLSGWRPRLGEPQAKVSAVG